MRLDKGRSFTGDTKYQPEVLLACLNQLLFFAAVLVLFRLALRLFDAPVAWISTDPLCRVRFVLEIQCLGIADHLATCCCFYC